MTLIHIERSTVPSPLHERIGKAAFRIAHVQQSPDRLTSQSPDDFLNTREVGDFFICMVKALHTTEACGYVLCCHHHACFRPSIPTQVPRKRLRAQGSFA